jgi:tripartite-type tricarboxylate transporter receptor subunit TctC
MDYVKGGRLLPLGVTSAVRSELLPDVPTIGAFVPGYEASAWYAIGAPKATPADIVETLNETINDVLIAPDTRAQIAKLGSRLLLLKPAELGNLIASETEKWGNVVHAAGIRAS